MTVCICTRNRPDDLTTALKSVFASSRQVDEVIVSDDSTDDRTRRLVAETFPQVTFIEGPRRGLCANRNAALAVASGTHVLFIDDDAVLGNDFAANVLTVLDGLSPAERDRTIVGGIERQHGRLVYPSDQTFLGYQERHYHYGEPMNTVVINAALFPLRLFEDVGFDVNLIYGCDEVDITTRAVALGYRIVFRPDAINDHFPSPVNRDYYQTHLHSSRLYVTFKRYWFTARTYRKAVGYALFAPIHLAANLLKRRGLAGLRAAGASIVEALVYIVKYLRSRPDGPVRASAATPLQTASR